MIFKLGVEKLDPQMALLVRILSFGEKQQTMIPDKYLILNCMFYVLLEFSEINISF